MIRFIESFGDFAFEWTAATKEQCLEQIGKMKVDIVLMDLNLTGSNLDGIETALEIGRLCDTKVIMLTSLSSEEIVLDSFTAGALDFVQKKNYKLIPNKIRAMMTNNTPQEILLKEFNRLKKEEQIKSLSPAEKEIFSLLEQGYSKTEIENMLYKSKDTLKNQIKSLIKKMGVKSVKEAVEKVRNRGVNHK